MRSAFILAILLAPAFATASDRTCYRFGFVCDCVTRICEGGAVMPMPKHKKNPDRWS